MLRSPAKTIPASGRRLPAAALLATVAAVATFSVFPSAAGAAILKKPVPGPAVKSFVVTPGRLAWRGGPVTLKARVAHASRCIFVMHQSTIATTRTVACSSGSANARVTAKPNGVTSAQTLTFTVIAASGVRKATATRKLVQAPQPPPLEITSQAELPVGFAGTPYSVNLTATGGTGTYHWSVNGGALPAGLTLSPTGTISGTPTGPDGGTAGIQVQDDAGAVTQASVTVAIAGSALPPLSASDVGMSNNWSGYDVTGGPFTAAEGTFNIPSVPLTSNDTDTSEWVGIDGASDSNLIQAGVDESMHGGTETVYGWWEILPAPATVIPTLVINANDQVTVAIVRQADGNWLIQIQDLTDQQSWHMTIAYSGPLSSAEWIVEAPTAADLSIESLGQYTPPVTFTNLAVAGPISTLDQSVMYDPNYTTAISTPSPLTPSGFTVAYGAGAPTPPG